ncbi:MAG: hypothetical protein ACRYFW_15115 [Janthinobacterium lividum]
MLGGIPEVAVAGLVSRVPEGPRIEACALFFDPGGPRWPHEAAEPACRPVSPQATFWSWAAVALLVAALILPFSLVASIDLIRYLAR